MKARRAFSVSHHWRNDCMSISVPTRASTTRAVQVRLPAFGHDSLLEVGRKVRDIYADGAVAGKRVRALVDDAYVESLAKAVTGNLGGKVGVSPRLFLKKLVADVMDRVDQFEDFDPASTMR
jgi:hypothetical protein